MTMTFITNDRKRKGIGSEKNELEVKESNQQA